MSTLIMLCSSVCYSNQTSMMNFVTMYGVGILVMHFRLVAIFCFKGHTRGTLHCTHVLHGTVYVHLCYCRQVSFKFGRDWITTFVSESTQEFSLGAYKAVVICHMYS